PGVAAFGARRSFTESLLTRWMVTPPGGAMTLMPPMAPTCRPLPSAGALLRAMTGAVTLTVRDDPVVAENPGIVAETVVLPPATNDSATPPPATLVGLFDCVGWIVTVALAPPPLPL